MHVPKIVQYGLYCPFLLRFITLYTKQRDNGLSNKIWRLRLTVGGWVRSVRDSKTFGFIVLHDGSFFETLQIVYHDTMENFAEICKLNVGSAIIVKGTLVATPQAKSRTSSRGSRTVTVRKGDTLGAIARRNHTTVAALRRANGIKGSNIRPGQKLRLK